MYKLGSYPTPRPWERRLRGECVGFGFWCHLRLRNDGRQGIGRKRFAPCLRGRSAPQAVALVTALKVAVAPEHGARQHHANAAIGPCRIAPLLATAKSGGGSAGEILNSYTKDDEESDSLGVDWLAYATSISFDADTVMQIESTHISVGN